MSDKPITVETMRESARKPTEASTFADRAMPMHLSQHNLDIITKRAEAGDVIAIAMLKWMNRNEAKWATRRTTRSPTMIRYGLLP